MIWYTHTDTHTISTNPPYNIKKCLSYIHVAKPTVWSFVDNQSSPFSCRFGSDVIYVEKLPSLNGQIFKRTKLLATLDTSKSRSFLCLSDSLLYSLQFGHYIIWHLSIRNTKLYEVVLKSSWLCSFFKKNTNQIIKQNFYFFNTPLCICTKYTLIQAQKLD